MSKKPRGKPAWWKNSYFWIAGLLLVIALVGAIRGENAIRDPGQKRESGLFIIYLGGALVMVLNGWISHNQSMKYWEEEGLLPPPDEPKASNEGQEEA